MNKRETVREKLNRIVYAFAFKIVFNAWLKQQKRLLPNEQTQLNIAAVKVNCTYEYVTGLQIKLNIRRFSGMQ